MKTGESSGFVSSTEKESSVWLDFPGNQILQAILTKYRKKPNVLKIVNTALNLIKAMKNSDYQLKG